MIFSFIFVSLTVLVFGALGAFSLLKIFNPVRVLAWLWLCLLKSRTVLLVTWPR